MKGWMALSLLSAAAATAGVNSLDGLGDRNWPVGSAEWGMGGAGSARIKDGASLLDPARGAFDTQTRFAATLEMGWDLYAPDSGKNELQNSYRLPTVTLNIPIGLYGSFGASFWQAWAKDLKLGSGDTTLEYSGGMFELVPHAAVRGPGALRQVSAGFAWHVVGGGDLRHLDAVWYPSDTGWNELASGVRQVEDRKGSYDGDGYASGSLHWHGKNTEFAIGAYLPHDVERTDVSRYRGTSSDTVFPLTSVTRIHVPALLGTSMQIRLTKRHSVSVDYWQSNWDGSLDLDVERRLSAGWQSEGSGYAYDRFFAKNSFRAGLWWAEPGYQDIDEFGAAVGAGFPVGKRGARLDFALRGGVREAGEGLLAEPADRFWDASLTLVGVGAWGESQRRRR